jgi:hypothetical protein
VPTVGTSDHESEEIVCLLEYLFVVYILLQWSFSVVPMVGTGSNSPDDRWLRRLCNNDYHLMLRRQEVVNYMPPPKDSGLPVLSDTLKGKD